MNNEKFSIVTFYERRARRILPALFLVMLCCLPFAWLWLLPNHLKDFSQSLIAVSVFSSNILFWRESGYFGVVSELKPLLHTWSLAVEEQYYVLFPLFLMALWKMRKRWIFGALVVVGAFSLIATQWGAYNKPSATFFLLPTRGWELVIGALVAFYFLYKREHAEFIKSRKKTSDFLGGLGLLLICYSIFAFDKNTPFPSLYALIPTIGTGLIIIFSTTETAVGRFLSTKPIVGIGLISYSTYLWHQPLFVFARHRSLDDPSTALLLTLSAASLLLAYISWRFVESPFRSKSVINRNSIFAFAVICSVVFASIGIAGHVSNGFDKRVNGSGVLLSSIAEKVRINYGLSADCDSKFTLPENCRTSHEPEILLWGDSYAMHLAQGILASNPNAQMVQMTKSVCGPFFDIAPVVSGYSIDWAEGCIEFNNKVREWLKSNSTVKYVVLSSPFSQYVGNGNLLIGSKLFPAGQTLAMDYLVKTLSEIESMGVTPIIFSPPPSNGESLGECLVRHQHFGAELSDCNFSVGEISDRSNNIYDFLAGVHERYDVVSLKKGICKDDICQTSIGKTFIYRDDGHLSHEGSAALGKKMRFYEIITNKSLN